MATEVRCPSCGRQTALAPFCTHCGSAIPEGAARPRGLDRQGLDERIRQRRSAESPFRRGGASRDDGSSGGGPTAFVPEPTDELARHEPHAEDAEGGADAGPLHVDHLADAQPPATAWGASEPPMPSPPSAPEQPQPTSWAAGEPAAAPEPEPAPRPAAADLRAPDPVTTRGRSYESYPNDGDDAGTYDPYPYGDDAFGDGYGGEPPRRSGVIAILGFVVLGVAALFGGAIAFSLLSSSPGSAQASVTPSPTAAVTQQASASATAGASASAGGSSAASPSTSPSGVESPLPTAVPADFVAKVEPCATSDMDFNGCAVDGSTVSGGQVWVWVHFTNARDTDVVGVSVVDQASGSSVGDGSLELSTLGCNPDKPCTGYLQMRFGSLAAGDYEIQVTLNDVDVASASFTVTS